MGSKSQTDCTIRKTSAEMFVLFYITKNTKCDFFLSVWLSLISVCLADVLVYMHHVSFYSTWSNFTNITLTMTSWGLNCCKCTFKYPPNIGEKTGMGTWRYAKSMQCTSLMTIRPAMRRRVKGGKCGVMRSRRLASEKESWWGCRFISSSTIITPESWPATTHESGERSREAQEKNVHQSDLVLFNPVGNPQGNEKILTDSLKCVTRSFERS